MLNLSLLLFLLLLENVFENYCGYRCSLGVKVGYFWPEACSLEQQYFLISWAVAYAICLVVYCILLCCV